MLLLDTDHKAVKPQFAQNHTIIISKYASLFLPIRFYALY